MYEDELHAKAADGLSPFERDLSRLHCHTSVSVEHSWPGFCTSCCVKDGRSCACHVAGKKKTLTSWMEKEKKYL